MRRTGTLYGQRGQPLGPLEGIEFEEGGQLRDALVLDLVLADAQPVGRNHKKDVRYQDSQTRPRLPMETEAGKPSRRELAGNGMGWG